MADLDPAMREYFLTKLRKWEEAHPAPPEEQLTKQFLKFSERTGQRGFALGRIEALLPAKAAARGLSVLAYVDELFSKPTAHDVIQFLKTS
ncbi:MAG: hypothetical protein AAB601_00360 [Patescibacteria group bacterium]|mgnify:CR=1 FL=1